MEIQKIKMGLPGEEEEVAVGGWETPKRAEYRIPAAVCCPAPPKKKTPSVAFGKRGDPPNNGYFHPPDLEALFALFSRREACAEVMLMPFGLRATSCGVSYVQRSDADAVWFTSHVEFSSPGFPSGAMSRHLNMPRRSFSAALTRPEDEETTFAEAKATPKGGLGNIFSCNKIRSLTSEDLPHTHMNKKVGGRRDVKDPTSSSIFFFLYKSASEVSTWIHSVNCINPLSCFVLSSRLDRRRSLVSASSIRTSTESERERLRSRGIRKQRFASAMDPSMDRKRKLSKKGSGREGGPSWNGSGSVRDGRRRRSSSSNSMATATATRSPFASRCAMLVKEQKARFYIMRRCVTMLVRWRDYP
ncbi:hypothetical protein BHM03_00004928 [Ensete ventricosum]|nr:hypothetical protein BHM03_00004928 [Ensete ventricosum]